MAGAPVNSSQPLEDADIMEIYERDVMPIDDTDYMTTANVVQTTQKHDYGRSNSLGPDNLVDASSATGTKRKAQYLEDDGTIYGASRFGNFGEYMRRKRAKLQIQNASMDTEASGEGKSNIFKGISVYVRLCILFYVLGQVNMKRRNLDPGEWLDEAVGAGYPETSSSAWGRLPTIS
jgi:hypothetical protein